ncbi:MAG: hypothetical protein EXR69_13810 [Myxococcales bacterium]|nr:hypothetical protein [Myxococcales bacterium]
MTFAREPIALWLLAACPVEPATGVPDHPLPVEEVEDSGVPPVASPDPLAVRINEVMTQNDSSWQAADGSLPGWVELKNVSDVSILRADLAWDDGPISWVEDGADAATLEPGAVALAVLADNGKLTLTWHGLITDAIDPGTPGEDVAWARFPDGGGGTAFALTGQPTPGYDNGSAPPAGSPSDLYFADYARIDLQIPESSWASINLDPYGPVEATLGYERVWLPVTLHLKGVYGSLRTLQQKCSFSIDLNDARPGGTLRGLQKLKLNNMVQDPSGVHDTLTYTLYRAAGLAAPRTGYVQVYVNGEYYGVYANIEAEDDTFLTRNFGETGDLYEGAYGVDFYDGHETLFECDECANPDDRSDITAVITVLNGDATDAGIAALDEVIDLDQFLTNMAIEAYTLHWDGYTTANNYRIFLDPSEDRFVILPWGVDQTWIDEYYDPWSGLGRVLTFCNANPGCAANYNDRLLEIADLAESLHLDVTLADLLRTYNDDFVADPRVEWDLAAHNRYVSSTRTHILSGPQRVRDAVAGR